METVNVSKAATEEKVTYTDFGEETTYAGASSATVGGKDPAALAISHKKKADVVSALVTIGLNSLPVVTDVIKHRKDPTPYKVDKNELLCLGLSSAIPVFQAIDTVAFNGKAQDTINTKVFKNTISVNDVRNIVNLVNLYAPAHNLITQFADQSAAKAAGLPQTPIDTYTKAKVAIGVSTLFTPFISDKITDSSKSVSQRISSILPLPIIGQLVRTYVSKSTDRNVQNAYNITSAVLKTASAANQTLTPAVRATSFGNTANKVTSEVDSAIGLASQLFGVNTRSSISGGMYSGSTYNNGINGWGSGFNYN